MPVEIDKKEKVRVVMTMKKTLPKSMSDPMMSMRDMVVQMFVKSEGTPLGTLHSQSDGSLISTPMSTLMCTLIGTLMSTLIFKYDGTLLNTPSTPMGTANFKYDDEPMGRLMGLPPEFIPSNGRNYRVI